MKLKNEQIQNLAKAALGIAAFGFAATGHGEATPLISALVSVTGGWAGQFGAEVCMPYITQKWLSPHKEEIVNDHIQRALVAAISHALADVENEYFARHGVSAKEQASLRDFFAVLRDRSQLEYVEAIRSEVTKQEVLDYVYDQQTGAAHLQQRLKIGLDPFNDLFYFTPTFIEFFPVRFAERVKFHFREQLKGDASEQQKAKKALDLLFFETLQDALRELNERQLVHFDDQKTLLEKVLAVQAQALQQTDFYGEIWVSAIRQSRAQLDRVEQKQNETLQQIGYLRADMATRADVAAIGEQLRQLYSQSVQPGLLTSARFEELSRAVRELEAEMTTQRQAVAEADRKLMAAKQAVANSPDADKVIDELLAAKEHLIEVQSAALKTDQQRQEARQALTEFLNDIANTQKAILNTSSHRADASRRLFEEGQFEEANTALNVDDLRRDKADLLQRREADKRYAVQLAADFVYKATTVTLVKEPDWFVTAKGFYEEAIETDESLITYFSYAYFLAAHNQHQEAIKYYELSLPYITDEAESASVYLNLGNLYADVKRFDEAESLYKEALSVFENLSKSNPNIHIIVIAKIFNNLGMIYNETDRIQLSEIAHKNALEVIDESTHKKQLNYKLEYARSLKLLGGLYKKMLLHTDSESKHLEALAIFQSFADDEIKDYQPERFLTLQSLGILYKDMARFDEADALLNQSLTVVRSLSTNNPATYEPQTADTLQCLGNLYTDMKLVTKSETAFIEALEIFRSLNEINPAIYLYKVANVLNSLGLLYTNNEEYEKAETSYKEALNIRRSIAEQNSNIEIPLLARVLSNMGIMYRRTSRFQDAEIAYKEAFDIRLELAKRQPQIYGLYVAETALNISLLYLNLPTTPNREKSIEYAITAFFWLIHYDRNIPRVSQITITAVQICEHWGADWQGELKRRLEAGWDGTPI